MTARAGILTRLFGRPSLEQLAGNAGLVLIPATTPLHRLEKLRRSITSAWEEALTFGGGNYLEQVYIPQYVGLVDVAAAAEQLYLEPGNADARAALRRRLDEYLKDLDTAKAMRGVYGRAADERYAKVRRLQGIADLARALLAAAEPVIDDPYLRADYETTRGQLVQALADNDAATREAQGVPS